VAAVAGNLSLVIAVRKSGGKLGFLPKLVTVPARRSCLDVILGEIEVPVSVHLFFAVAIYAHRSLLVMDVRPSPIFPRVFGIYPPAVAKGAGLALIPFDELVSLDKADADPGDGRGLYVTATAGGVAAPA
jgi:hypothetical protein